MAAPSHKTLHNLSGHWTLNKSLSDPYEPVLALQDVNVLIRKAASSCSVHLSITQPSANELHIQQSATGAAIPGTKEDHTLDWEWRESKDPLFGAMKGRARWVGIEEAKKGGREGEWLDEAGDEGKLVQVEGQKPDDEWGGTHFLGFESVDGGRRFVRRVWLWNRKKGEEMNVRMVYDFDGEG